MHDAAALPSAEQLVDALARRDFRLDRPRRRAFRRQRRLRLLGDHQPAQPARRIGQRRRHRMRAIQPHRPRRHRMRAVAAAMWRAAALMPVRAAALPVRFRAIRERAGQTQAAVRNPALALRMRAGPAVPGSGGTILCHAAFTISRSFR
jgi:hypothetical protein